MRDKSSTSLAMVSVLSIVIVLFIAIGNVEDAPIRKPFANGRAMEEKAPILNSEIKKGTDLPVSIGEKPNKVDKSGKMNEFGAYKVDILESTEQNSKSGENLPKTPSSSTYISSGVKDDIPFEINISSTETLFEGINSEQLSKAGYRNFYIKSKPFDGKLFGIFDVSMLMYLDILHKSVVTIKDGFEEEILSVFQFSFEEDNAAGEIYDYIKNNIKNSLSITLNETNQFGRASFFINFDPPKNTAFLVVKTKNNVYALSYPKEDGINDNFKLISNLLSALP